MSNEKWFAVVLFFVLLPGPAGAMFLEPTYAPVDRLLANTKAFVDENPNSHEGHYTLARIHYLAFANKANLVGAREIDSFPPRIAPDWLLPDLTYYMRRQRAEELALEEAGYSSQSDIPDDERSKFWKIRERKQAELNQQRWKPKELDEAQLLAHASAAARSFRKAIELDPDNALYHLGLASLYHQYLQLTQQANVKERPAELRDVTLKKTRDMYYSAYELSIKKDLKLRHMPASGLESLVGYEAAKAYVSLAMSEPSPSWKERWKVSRAKRNLKRLERLPMGAITPIVFSMEEHCSLGDLLEPGLLVLFDLDGDGFAEYWPWVKPTTGFLVWDPEEEGLIGSGRRLFGSALWWLFFPNGYRALDALDDNRDGTLSGLELRGIAVWFDRNSNGRSDYGEVIPVTAVGVRALETRPTGEHNGSPMNKAGLTLIDGKVLPTYDWVTSPVKTAVTVPLNRKN